MMQSKSSEILVGLFVALGIAALFMLAMKVSNLADFTEDKGYEVVANFQNIGGLKVRSPVTLAGVRVGRVTGIRLNPNNYLAEVRMNIYPGVELPLDTSASIFTAGLLGEQYIYLDAGGEDDLLQDGDAMSYTQPALVLEQVIGQFLYSMAEGE